MYKAQVRGYDAASMRYLIHYQADGFEESIDLSSGGELSSASVARVRVIYPHFAFLPCSHVAPNDPQRRPPH